MGGIKDFYVLLNFLIMCKFLKIISLAVVSFLLMSCGGTTVKVRQSSDGVNATVSVTTNNPTNVEVTPSIVVDVGELEDVLDSLQVLSSEPISFNFDNNGVMEINLESLCKSINHKTLIRQLSSSELPYMKFCSLIPISRCQCMSFLIGKTRNINTNLCVNRDISHNSELRI